MAFSDKLVAARKAKKLSQESLSKISGVSQSAISFIEKGMRSPTEETMKLLADALGVAVTDLMDNAQKKPIPEDELRESNAVMLVELSNSLSPQEWQQVLAFVEGLKAARLVQDSPGK